MTIYLDESDLLAAARVILGRDPEVRDPGLLSSALARPAASMYGQDAYPGFHEKAAALLISVTNNHSLIDGNKRLGWLATLYFYDVNDRVLTIEEDDAYDLVMSIAKGVRTDVADVAKILAAHSRDR
ncbi:type II toxin-antitoxin system death-on-curing family toxin [Cellulosimicrobium cellulans]|uniref:type II toxin-antitoxin system death-on-curing family toxin n=1 Tax=Cellulosimicrobium cellulans TaxID=1710 RepID=UPI001EDAFCCD|nr:type II toxin-antitoxin system death-on-curing family toxin [Cellulosimicrobium cellulans]UKJ63273.1 type II toxin-antitoxin system death-on-curing family toxin [Cellulosimicrobium cellulans]